jgi:ABC-type transport system involved in cytochrome c biogenesis permease component
MRWIVGASDFGVASPSDAAGARRYSSVIIVSLFPLGVGPETELLKSVRRCLGGTLLASMLSLGRLFD